jgi:beta-glucuronidase
MYERLRELDPSRPTTSATCNFPTDICLDLPDIVSVNVYPLWYRAAGVAEYMGEVLDFVRSSPGGGKPLIVSEIGAGAIPGFRDTRRAKWSEERQADILSEQLGHVCELDEVTGVYIWQFADCRVTEGLFAHRPRTRNNKGVVDEYRRPKLAYETVR